MPDKVMGIVNPAEEFRRRLLQKLNCFNAANGWIIYPIAQFSFKLFFKTWYVMVTALFPVMVEKKKKSPLP